MSGEYNIRFSTIEILFNFRDDRFSCTRLFSRLNTWKRKLKNKTERLLLASRRRIPIRSIFLSSRPIIPLLFQEHSRRISLFIETITIFSHRRFDISRDNSLLRDTLEWRNRGTRVRRVAVARLGLFKVAQGRSTGARTLLGLWKRSTANWSPPTRAYTRSSSKRRRVTRNLLSLLLLCSIAPFFCSCFASYVICCPLMIEVVSSKVCNNI